MINKVNAEHYTWGNNCNSWILCDSETLSVKQEKMPPGTKEQLHFHAKAQQFFYILNGTAVFYVENVKTIVSANEGIHIIPGSKHSIANESDASLEFLVISQPATSNDRITIE